MTQKPQPPLVVTVDHSIVLKPRSFATEDAVFDLIQNNFAYLSQWIYWVEGYTKERLHQDIKETIDEHEQGILCLMDIFVDGKLAGAVDASNILIGDSAEIGYWVGEEFAGKGIATKSVEALLKVIQERYGVVHFYLLAAKDNKASNRVAEKAGFQAEKDIENTEQGVIEVRYVKNYA